jgi:hypothetical protein
LLVLVEVVSSSNKLDTPNPSKSVSLIYTAVAKAGSELLNLNLPLPGSLFVVVDSNSILNPVVLTPSAPDEPEVPLEPDVPEEPDVPLEPDVPDVPVVPEVPDEPEVPLDPEVPDEPLVPLLPSAPLVLLCTSPELSTTKNSVKEASKSTVSIVTLPPT